MMMIFIYWFEPIVVVASIPSILEVGSLRWFYNISEELNWSKLRRKNLKDLIIVRTVAKALYRKLTPPPLNAIQSFFWGFLSPAYFLRQCCVPVCVSYKVEFRLQIVRQEKMPIVVFDPSRKEGSCFHHTKRRERERERGEQGMEGKGVLSQYPLSEVCFFRKVTPEPFKGVSLIIQAHV